MSSLKGPHRAMCSSSGSLDSRTACPAYSAAPGWAATCCFLALTVGGSQEGNLARALAAPFLQAFPKSRVRSSTFNSDLLGCGEVSEGTAGSWAGEVLAQSPQSLSHPSRPFNCIAYHSTRNSDASPSLCSPSTVFLAVHRALLRSTEGSHQQFSTNQAGRDVWARGAVLLWTLWCLGDLGHLGVLGMFWGRGREGP